MLMPYMATLNIIFMRKIVLYLVLILTLNNYAQTGEPDTATLHINEIRNIQNQQQKKNSRELMVRIFKIPKSMEKVDSTITDITELGSSSGESKATPLEFAEAGAQLNWNPNSMSYEDMEREASIYYRKKYMKWGYIGLGICSLIGAFIFIRKLTK